MQIEIYTRQGCSQCAELKEILQKQNVEYIEHEIDRTVTRDQVISKFPGVKMLPVILVDSVLVSSENLMTLIEEKKV